MNALTNSDTETETHSTIITVPSSTRRSDDPNKHETFVPKTFKEGWHEIANYSDIVKWQYKDSPYRVIAYLHDDTGHWRAIFTSWYDSGSYLIRGNCGGGNKGRMLAVAAAKQFIAENKYGCPPPDKYEP